MITVGRLGTYQKNTEMLLNALDLMELRDWKVYFRGFGLFFEGFFYEKPVKKGISLFCGSNL